MSQYIIQQIVNGLTLGSLYALVASGFAMIYGIVRLINFAHGDIVMVGAFSAFGMVALGVPWFLIVPFVLLIGALAGAVIEVAVFRPIRGAPQVTGFIANRFRFGQQTVKFALLVSKIVGKAHSFSPVI
jgi:branched-chain amino acid transport system permease protein